MELSPEIQQKLAQYPELVTARLLEVRALILAVAAEQDIIELQEGLKWGQATCTSKIGSPIRYDWDPKSPSTFQVYFHCQTRLVETFKELYGDRFVYQGDRVLVFQLDTAMPEVELKHCLLLALSYKKRKHLNLLGA